MVVVASIRFYLLLLVFCFSQELKLFKLLILSVHPHKPLTSRRKDHWFIKQTVGFEKVTEFCAP